MKRIISAGLCTAFILSLAGCARQDTTPSLTAADTTDTQMGRWVESRVDLGGEPLISYPTQLADGTVVLYTGKVGEDSIEDYTRPVSYTHLFCTVVSLMQFPPRPGRLRNSSHISSKVMGSSFASGMPPING